MEKDVFSVFKEKMRKHEETNRALIELVEENKTWLHLRLVKKDFSPELMRHIAKGLFYQETKDPILKIIHKGDFYKKEREGDVPYVQKIKEIEQKERDEILKGLDGFLRGKKVPRMLIPEGYFIFRFKAKTSKEDIIKGGKEKMLVVTAEKLEGAILELKKKLKGMKEDYFRDFMFFQPSVNRWRILRTDKLRGGWLPKEYAIIADFQVIS